MIPNPNLDSELERGSQMRLGTTTFSFTNEWLAGSVSLAQMLGRVGREGPDRRCADFAADECTLQIRVWRIEAATIHTTSRRLEWKGSTPYGA